MTSVCKALLVLLLMPTPTDAKVVLYQIAPVYPTGVQQVVKGQDLWVIPVEGTQFAMTIYTDEPHIAEWVGDRLHQPMWWYLEPELRPYPSGLIWRVNTVAVYDLETGVWIESVTTRRKE